MFFPVSAYVINIGVSVPEFALLLKDFHIFILLTPITST